VTMLVFIALGWLAVLRFHPATGASPPGPLGSV
jgi:hypothetical protein